MLDNTKIFNKDTYGHFDFLEDEIDCAIAGDIKFDQVLDELEKINPSTDNNIELDHIDDVIDPTIDYSESMPDVDSVSIDADMLIDAEREINSNPFDEDELIETVIDIDLVGDRGIANRLFYENVYDNESLNENTKKAAVRAGIATAVPQNEYYYQNDNDTIYEEEIEYNPNTYNAVLLEALTPKQKKLLKIGAAVAGATALGYGAYKYNQNRKAAEEEPKQKAAEEPKQKAAEEPKQKAAEEAAQKREAEKQKQKAEKQRYMESEEFKKLKKAYDDLKREYDDIMNKRSEIMHRKDMTSQERDKLISSFNTRLGEITDEKKKLEFQCEYSDLLY